MDVLKLFPMTRWSASGEGCLLQFVQTGRLWTSNCEKQTVFTNHMNGKNLTIGRYQDLLNVGWKAYDHPHRNVVLFYGTNVTW